MKEGLAGYPEGRVGEGWPWFMERLRLMMKTHVPALQIFTYYKGKSMDRIFNLTTTECSISMSGILPTDSSEG